MADGTNSRFISLEELVEKGALSAAMAEVLKTCVQGRFNIFRQGW